MIQPAPILQSRLPVAAWMAPQTARLPGIQPVTGDDWLRVDEAFAGQMAERDRLIATCPDAVHALLPEARPAAAELLDRVLAKLAQTPGYAVAPQAVTRPDGVTVALDPAAPLLTLGRLVQEDLCLMQTADEKAGDEKAGDEPVGDEQAGGKRVGGEHRLTGAILCFPASWLLAEKIGRPLTGIHAPVAPYTPDMARRVQRLFDAIRPDQPLWRANFLTYDDPTLHQPRREGARRPRPVAHSYLRSERQCLLRLPRTGAVVFTIHTYVVPVTALSAAEREGLRAMDL